MNAKLVMITMMLTGLIAIAGDCQAQTTQGRGTLAVKGYPGTAPLTQVDGRSYVDVAMLAQLTQGTLSYSGATCAIFTVGLPPVRWFRSADARMLCVMMLCKFG